MAFVAMVPTKVVGEVASTAVVFLHMSLLLQPLLDHEPCKKHIHYNLTVTVIIIFCSQGNVPCAKAAA